MLQILVYMVLFLSVYGGQSPNGQQYLSQLSNEELARIPPGILEDARLDVPGLITKYGYIAETHVVQTHDGYILHVHRIAGRKGNQVDKNRPIVLLIHGLMGSSSDWIVMGPERGLGYILSDQGYDVWMGNVRGNFYSRNHTSLNPDKSKKYWNFSFHEIGTIDVPATIDHILYYTGSKKLHYIGHSEGSTRFFVMASSIPEYNDKVISMHAFGPTAYLYHVNDSGKCSIANFLNFIKNIPALLSMREVLARNTMLSSFTQKLCNDDTITAGFCIYVLFGSENMKEVNRTTLPVLLGHVPSGASLKQFFHHAQLHVMPKFQQYDYGFAINLMVYKSKSPPSYDLSKVSTPVYLHYAINDNSAVVEDVMVLHSQLPNAELCRVPHEKFGHLDFVWSTNVKPLLYDRVVEQLKKYS